MSYHLTPLTLEAAQEICTWRYADPYSIYNFNEDGENPEQILVEMLDQRSPHYAVYTDDRTLFGFFAYGTAGLVWDYGEPRLYERPEERVLPIGLGMRPNLTGQGLGLPFVVAGLDFARAEFAPETFLMYVLPFNERAIKVYERAGFERSGVYLQRRPGFSEREFIELRRPAQILYS